MARKLFEKIGHFLFPAYDISAEGFIEQFNGIDHPKWEVRLIRKNGKSATFFFDSVYLENGVFHGSKSRILNLEGKVPAADIDRVRIRNNRKRYIYKN
jgi:hypothetical protein